MLQRLGPVVGAVLVVAVLLLVFPADPEPTAGESSAAVDAAFVAAYERSRTVEVVVESTVTRTYNDGRELTYDRRLVQRPPDDVLLIGAGSATGRLGGRIVRCNATAGGVPECIQSVEAPPFTEAVAAEVASLESLVAEVYEVERAGAGCFVLTLERPVASPPYGGAARFCFDPATGALAGLEVRRPEVVEVLEAVRIRTEVTAADLRADSLGDPIDVG